LGGLRLLKLALQPLGGARETVATLLERLEAALEASHLGVAQLDAGPEGAQLATDLGRLTARPGDALGQAGLEPLALARQLRLGGREPVGLGHQLPSRRG